MSRVVLPGHAEHIITITRSSGRIVDADGKEMASALRRELDKLRAVPVCVFVFGGEGDWSTIRRELSGLQAGVSFLQGDGAAGNGAPVLQAVAVSGARVTNVVQRGTSTGVVVEDEFMRVCRLGSVVAGNVGGAREDQAREVLLTAEGLLTEAGFQFTDTVRTWFYLDHLLEWYDRFNAVRNGFFVARGLYNGLVPASTGIGAGNATGSALSCDLLAIQAKKAGVGIRAVPSPMQESALNYKSSFSRAVEIMAPGFRQLLVSGTASIDRNGQSAHGGDPAAQIGLTVQVVDALLKSREMGWTDVTRGIAYFKRMADRPLLERCFGEQRIMPFPLALVEADICRHELDFEIEIDAVRV